MCSFREYLYRTQFFCMYKGLIFFVSKFDLCESKPGSLCIRKTDLY